MNYLSGAFRYVAGSDADRHDEVRRLMERIKNASLAQDRRSAILQLAQLAQESPRRQAEIGEIGLKVFYAVLDQDKQYQANVRAVLQLLISICSDAPSTVTTDSDQRENADAIAHQKREARNILATNVDMFLGLPDAISLILDQLSHEDYNIRGFALELLTAMAAYSQQTLQAAILDASLGVSRICDLLDDSQQIIRSNTVILLSMICPQSPEVSKIVTFSGVPEKLFDLILSVNPKASSLTNLEVSDDFDTSLEAAVIVQEVLELLGTLIDSSSTTRTAILEMSHVGRIVDILTQIVRDSSVTSENIAVELGFSTSQISLLKQNTKNISLLLLNITKLLQGDQADVQKMLNELSNTSVFNQVQILSFLEYVESDSINSPVNLELASIRIAALRALSVLVNAHTTFRMAFCSSLCSSPMLDAATPQICTLHTMLHDRCAALRVAAFVALRDSFVLDSAQAISSPALVNALTGSSSLISLIQTSGGDPEMDEEEEDEINIPSKFLAILGEALKDALTLYPKESDEAGVFYSCMLVAWTMFRVPGARERLLASYAHNAGNSLFPQIMRVLSHSQRNQAPASVLIAYMSLICSWLYGSPSAVSTFLSSAMHLPMVVEIFNKGISSDESYNVHIKGLAAVILGICYEATDGESAVSDESGFIAGGRGPSMVIPRGTISDVIRNHIGVTDFTSRLEDIRATPQFTQSLSGAGLWKLSSEIARVELGSVFLGEKELGHEYWYDPDIVALIDSIYAQIGPKAVDLLPTRSSNAPANNAGAPNGEVQNYTGMTTTNPAPSRTMEMMIVDSAKDEVLNSYKQYIKSQDESLSSAQTNVEKLEKALREAEGKISILQASTADNIMQHPTKDVNGIQLQRDIHAASVPEINDNNYTNGVASTNNDNYMHANGGDGKEDDDKSDAALRARELAAVVMHLEEELEEQRERSHLLMDDLDNSRRSQEDWRRKAEESGEKIEKQAVNAEQALKQVEELSEEVAILKAETLAKVEETSSSNRRISELEDRCAELADMRKRAEQEIATVKEEVALRAEQNIELSGKLYEAEERTAALEEAREQLASNLVSLKSAHRSAVASSSDRVSNEELNVVRKELGIAHKLNQNLKFTFEDLQLKSQKLEDSKVELSNQLDKVRVRYEELATNNSSLTASIDKINKETVSRETYQLLQQNFSQQSDKLSIAENENEKLKGSVQELKAAALAARVSSEESIVMRKELDIAQKLNQDQQSTIKDLKIKSQKLEDSKAEFNSQLEEERVRYGELAINNSSLTASIDKINKETVSRETYQLLQQDFSQQSDKLSIAENENEKLKGSVQELKAEVLAAESPTPKRPRSNSSTQTEKHTEENVRLLNKKVEIMQSALSEAATVAKNSCDELLSAETSLRILLQPDSYTEKAYATLVRMREVARSSSTMTIEAETLLRALLADDFVKRILERLGSASRVRDAAEAFASRQPRIVNSSGELLMGASPRETLEVAARLKTEFGDQYIALEHMLIACWRSGRLQRGLLSAPGIPSADAVLEAVRAVRGNKKVTSQAPEVTYEALEKYGRDLTQAARKGELDPVIGRDEEIRRTIQILSRRQKNNPVLLGEPGVGKTAVAEGLARRMVSGDIPQSLKGRRLISLDLGALIAGAKERGEFEERLKAVLKDVKDANPGVVLFIDEIHTVVGAGKTDGALDAANLLKSMLARGELRCIGATTLNEYRQYIEKDAALERRFQQVMVDQPNVPDTISILRGLKERYELHHGVRITDSALVAAATLSNRYITDRFLPGKAIGTVDEAMAALKMQITSKPAELDRLDRKIIQMEMEKLSLKNDIDKESLTRLIKLSRDIATVKEEQRALEVQWEAERSSLTEIQKLKEEIDKITREIEQAEQSYDLDRAARLKYSALPNLEKKLGEAEESVQKASERSSLLRDKVTEDDIATVVSQWTRIPISKLLSSERDKLLNLEDDLSKRVIGQSDAVIAVSEAIQRSRAGLSNPSRPIACLAFLGPTGVGKTELCKALAEQLFDTEGALVRIDMSEYMEKHSVSRLIGSPPGYVGYDQGGQLSEVVRRRPFSVVLFDEIEKAHPDVTNVLLQVLDEGCLTDGQGRTVDFTNSVLIFRSTVGSSTVLDVAGDSSRFEIMRAHVIEAMHRELRPEFLNRIDETIIFKSLAQEDLCKIAELQLNDVNRRLAEKNMRLEATPEVMNLVASVGFDPVYGARPLRRAVQRLLENPISKGILKGEFRDGDLIEVIVENERLSFVPMHNVVGREDEPASSIVEYRNFAGHVPPNWARIFVRGCKDPRKVSQ